MLDFRSFDFSRLNEADVRAEIIDPLLRTLGYQAGAENNVIQEGTLRYEYIYLGRKTKRDLQIGRPDYVLEVGGYGRWILEAKSPASALVERDFEQAKSYALHPEIAAPVFVITNGRELWIYRASDPFEAPLIKLSYDELRDRWLLIESILSPAGFRRHVPLPTFSPDLPLARGFTSSMRLGAGVAVPSEVRATSSFGPVDLTPLANIVNHIPRGRCERNQDGRIKTTLEFSSSTAFTQEVLSRKGLRFISFETDDEYLSLDPNIPTLLRAHLLMVGEQGESLFDVAAWEARPLPFTVRTSSHITASVYIADSRVTGAYSLLLTGIIPDIPDALFVMEQIGEVTIDIL
jgi:hypothetical protein